MLNISYNMFSFPIINTSICQIIPENKASFIFLSTLQLPLNQSADRCNPVILLDSRPFRSLSSFSH